MTYNRVLGQLEGNNTISSGDTMLVLAEHSRKQFVDEIWALLTSEKKQYFGNILLLVTICQLRKIIFTNL